MNSDWSKTFKLLKLSCSVPGVQITTHHGLSRCAHTPFEVARQIKKVSSCWKISHMRMSCQIVTKPKPVDVLIRSRICRFSLHK